jgi:hypothetical protein
MTAQGMQWLVTTPEKVGLATKARVVVVPLLQQYEVGNGIITESLTDFEPPTHPTITSNSYTCPLSSL